MLLQEIYDKSIQLARKDEAIKTCNVPRTRIMLLLDKVTLEDELRELQIKYNISINSYFYRVL